MVSYSMARQRTALFHFPAEVVRALSADLVPVTEAGYFPLKVEITAEVAGQLGSSGVLIPIKTLDELLIGAISDCPHLHDNVDSLLKAFLPALQTRLASARGGAFSADVTLKNCQFTFENGVVFRAAPEVVELSYSIVFQHVFDLDVGSDGRPIKHGHDADLCFTLQTSSADALRIKAAFDAFVQERVLPVMSKVDYSAQGASMPAERILQRAAGIIDHSPFREKVTGIRLRETEKNSFSLSFDRLQS